MDCVVASRRIVLSSPARVKVARPRQIRISASGNTPIELPGGAYWWLGGNNSSSSVIYGENFVLQRTRVGGPGLVPSRQNVSVQTFRSPRSGPPAVRPQQPTGMILSGMVVLDTEWEEISSNVELISKEPRALPNSWPPSTCTGIVYVGSGDNEIADARILGAASSRHPRRTRRMRFTCNLCETVNEKDVNPNAWRTGSVFARCDECTAVHKLKDNLKVRRVK